MIDKLQKTFSPDDTLYAKDMNLVTGKIDEIVESVNSGSSVGKVDPNSNGTGEIFNHYKNNKATGDYSHAEGGNTTASGYGSHAEGFETTASNDSSHAEGENTTASGYASHAEGSMTTAEGENSHAEGYNTIASSDYSHVEGKYVMAYGGSSHAEGSYTNTRGYASHAEGSYTETNGDSSHAEGYCSMANCNASHAEGGHDELDEALSVIFEKEGDKYYVNKLIKGLFRYNGILHKLIYIEGPNDNNKYSIKLDRDFSVLNKEVFIRVPTHSVDTDFSHVEGYGCHTYASSSDIENFKGLHAEGFNTTASGAGSHSEGIYTIANNASEHAQGNYNKSNTGSTEDLKTIHSIGVGTEEKRMNAQEVMRNGDHYVLGIGGYDGTNPESAQTLQEVIKGITDGMGEINSLLDQINGEVV